MKIDEAIARLNGLISVKKPILGERDFKAFALGIEALKAWKEHREHHLPQYQWLLPGETED